MWRVLGVAVVLLALGLVGGYVVAEQSGPQPVTVSDTGPLAAESPAVPTPPVATVLPDPGSDALSIGIPLVPFDFRNRVRAAGLTVDVPEGWIFSRQTTDLQWTFDDPESPSNTYLLRVRDLLGSNGSASAAKSARLVALQDAEDNGGIADLRIVAETDDAFEVTYNAGGYIRYSMERFISLDGTHVAANVAVVGRQADVEGLRDLLTRVSGSVEELPALPEPTETPSSSDSPSPDASGSPTQ